MEHLDEHPIGIFGTTKPIFALYDNLFLWQPSLSGDVTTLLSSYLNLKCNKSMRWKNLMAWGMLFSYCEIITSFCGIGVFYGQLVKAFSSQVSIVEVVKNVCLSCHDISPCKFTRIGLILSSYVEHELLVVWRTSLYVSILNVHWNDNDLYTCEIKEKFVVRVASLIKFTRAHLLVLLLRFVERVAKCIHFIGMLNRDLRTNPSQEREDHANQGKHHMPKAIPSRAVGWLGSDTRSEAWRDVPGGRKEVRKRRRRRNEVLKGVQRAKRQTGVLLDRAHVPLDRAGKLSGNWQPPSRWEQGVQ